MRETLNIEAEDVYETPLPGQVGDCADAQGEGVEISEGTREYFGDS